MRATPCARLRRLRDRGFAYDGEHPFALRISGAARRRPASIRLSVRFALVSGRRRSPRLRLSRPLLPGAGAPLALDLRVSRSHLSAASRRHRIDFQRIPCCIPSAVRPLSDNAFLSTACGGDWIAMGHPGPVSERSAAERLPAGGRNRIPRAVLSGRRRSLSPSLGSARHRWTAFESLARTCSRRPSDRKRTDLRALSAGRFGDRRARGPHPRTGPPRSAVDGLSTRDVRGDPACALAAPEPLPPPRRQGHAA